MGYVYLFIAIISEVVATNLLKASMGFTKLGLTGLCLLTYVLCFYSLSRSLNYIPLNVAYASWGAIGILFITLFSVVYWKETVNIPTIIGLLFIVIGTILVNVYGKGH